MEPEARHKKQQRSFATTLTVLAILLLWATQAFLARKSQPRDVAYDELQSLIAADKVAELELRSNEIMATLQPDPKGQRETVRAARLPNVDEAPLISQVAAHHVRFRGRADVASPWSTFLISWALPIGLLALFYGWGMRRMPQP
jgi:ATP-dependent Zn protease